MRAECLVLSIGVVLCGLSCDTTDPPPPPPPPPFAHPLTITLSVQELGLTDAWIRIRIPDSIQTRAYRLFCDTQAVVTIDNAPVDTAIWSTSLAAHRTYGYRAYRLLEGSVVDSSNRLLVTTLDSTSHEFFWSMDTLGIQGNLNDAAIVSPTDIWCVGKIVLRDSIYFLNHNVAHWDGTSWSIKRLQFPVYNDSCALMGTGGHEGWGIQLDHTGHGYLTDGADALEKRDTVMFPSCIGGHDRMTLMRIQDLFGTLWMHGMGGWIIRKSGNEWVQEATPTTLAIRDMAARSSQDIFAVGVSDFPVTSVVLQRQNGPWIKMMDGLIEPTGFDRSQLFVSQLYGLTQGLWVDERGTVYVAGSFLYKFDRGTWDYVRSLPDNSLEEEPITTRGYLGDVCGNASNDMFIAGAEGTIMHFNGSTWRSIGPGYQFGSPLRFWRVTCFGNIVVAVGTVGDKALVIRLWR